MRKLTLGVALILLIALVMPVLAWGQINPNPNSERSVSYYASWLNPICESANEAGYSEIGYCISFDPPGERHGLSDPAQTFHRPQ